MFTMYSPTGHMYSVPIAQMEGEQQMQHEINENNRALLMGTATTVPNDNGEFILSVTRLSGMPDNIPVVLSETVKGASITIGENLTVKGRFQSHNKIVGDRSKLMLTVYAEEITADNDINNPNQIDLVGYICKAPIYRTTPFNREIADLLLAVNRCANKSDYIPAIAWGRNARFSKNLLIGDKVQISGRIQSREYQKRFEDGTIETRTAYELSINTITKAAE